VKPGEHGLKQLGATGFKKAFETGGILQVRGGGQTCTVCFPGGSLLPSLSTPSSRVEHLGVEPRSEFDTEHGLSWEIVADFPCGMSRIYLTMSGEKLAGPYVDSLKPGDRGNTSIVDFNANRASSRGGIAMSV
jgi:hypothetical protein